MRISISLESFIFEIEYYKFSAAANNNVDDENGVPWIDPAKAYGDIS